MMNDSVRALLATLFLSPVVLGVGSSQPAMGEGFWDRDDFRRGAAPMMERFGERSFQRPRYNREHRSDGYQDYDDRYDDSRGYNRDYNSRYRYDNGYGRGGDPWRMGGFQSEERPERYGAPPSPWRGERYTREDTRRGDRYDRTPPVPYPDPRWRGRRNEGRDYTGERYNGAPSMRSPQPWRHQGERALPMMPGSRFYPKQRPDRYGSDRYGANDAANSSHETTPFSWETEDRNQPSFVQDEPQDMMR